MTLGRAMAWAALGLALPVVLGAASPELQVLRAGPVGEISKLEEVNEIRVVFSEPMVPLGRIPETVSAPFFTIKPEIPGRLRWSGTNTLIFTPSDPAKLPYATRYQVTVGEGATSVAGRRLARPYAFSFTTPDRTPVAHRLVSARPALRCTRRHCPALQPTRYA